MDPEFAHMAIMESLALSFQCAHHLILLASPLASYAVVLSRKIRRFMELVVVSHWEATVATMHVLYLLAIP